MEDKKKVIFDFTDVYKDIIDARSLARVRRNLFTRFWHFLTGK